MKVSTGSLLVLLWTWCSWQTLASPEECDVEGLRCEVICSFPDLTLHCTRCLNRRPMRFGKRSKGPTHIQSKGSPFRKFGRANYQLDVDSINPETLVSDSHRHIYGKDESSAASLLPPRSRTPLPLSSSAAVAGGGGEVGDLGPEILNLNEVNSEGVPFGRLARTFSSTTDHLPLMEKVVDDDLSAVGTRKLINLPEAKALGLFGNAHYSQMQEAIPPATISLKDLLSHNSNSVAALPIFLNNFPRQDITFRPSLLSFSSYLRANRFRGFNKVSNKPLITSPVLNKREEFNTLSDRDNFASDKRWKRSDKESKRSVQEVIKGLMELLGLNELPVDPKLYGCQEIPLPFSRNSYIILNTEE